MALDATRAAVAVRQTPRLTLRPPREDDLDTFATWMADEAALKWMHERTLDRDEAWQVLAMMVGHWAFRGFGPWMLEETGTGRLVGRGGLWRPEGWPGVEFIVLIAPDARLSGLATEVGRETMRCAFDVLELEALNGFIAPSNTRSIALATTLGFAFRGTWQPRPGTLLNVYSVQREEYPRLAAAWS
jgi:RimJ/RimL family protein N-acetyltransferase